MQSVQRRLEKLSRSFPALKDIEPERLSAAALKYLSEEELLLLLDVIEKLESSPVPPLSESESQAVGAYNNALALASRQARRA